MGLFLRISVPCSRRVTKCLLESSKFHYQRQIDQFPRLLVHGKSTFEEDSFLDKKSSSSSTDDDFVADFKKFIHDDQISFPRSTAESTDFVTGANDDPDTFGTFSKEDSYVFKNLEGSENDLSEDKFTSELPNYLPQKQYADMIKKFLNQRRFADALDVLQVTMLKEHRVKPEYYIYSILISYCGLTGYSKMAVKLYNDMKKRGLSVKPSVYTSLFNSFANSPFVSDGLKRTRHLLALMIEKDIKPNQITCHAIIKAFGRCGSLEEAFKVVDYMMRSKMLLTPHTISFLFHGCISDKEAGFRHALLVYRKMMEYKITPDVIHYNLFLHCLRDCSIGDLDTMIDVFKKLGVQNFDKLLSGNANRSFVELSYPWEEDPVLSSAVVSGSEIKALCSEETGQVQQINTEKYQPLSLLPNLLAYPPTLGCLASLTEIQTPQDRLFLLGGYEGFLKEMDKMNVKANIKTISLLLECIPRTCTAEEALISLAEQMSIQLDLLFFNSIIRRRVRRLQYLEAKEVLSKITAHGLEPDLMTFINLAMTCRKKTDAYELLKAMDVCGIRPTIELLTALLGCASVTYQMKYVKLVLDVIDYEELKVNSYFLKKSDEFYEKCQKILKIRPDKFSPIHLDAVQNFCRMYPKWKENVPVEEKQHPWQQFREKYPQETQTDREFLDQHVEKFNVTGRKFSRLGPDTVPKMREARMKELKKEYPGNFRNKSHAKPIKDQLVGLESVTFDEHN